MPSIFLVNSWLGIINLILMLRLVFVSSKVPPSSRHFIMKISAHCDSDGLVVLWLTILPPLMEFIFVTAPFLENQGTTTISQFFRHIQIYSLLWFVVSWLDYIIYSRILTVLIGSLLNNSANSDCCQSRA